MKLELKHLASYLPYKLNVLDESNDLGILIQLRLNENMENEFVVDTIESDGDYQLINRCKPILRPMSDLVKEIYHNDEKFIPIQVLFESTLMDEWLDCGKEHLKDFKIHVDDKSFYYYIFNDGEIKCSFGYYIYDQSFSFYHGYDEYSVQEQLYLFQLLFEWHFDVFGLIEQKLAVDINTFK